jgi:hypothetical protein
MAYCFGKLLVNIWQQAANWSLSVIISPKPMKTCEIFSGFGLRFYLPGARLIEAEILVSNYSLSFWDAMVIAACLEAGVTRLYSEDFDAYVHVDGLQIVNPFKTVSTS